MKSPAAALEDVLGRTEDGAGRGPSSAAGRSETWTSLLTERLIEFVVFSRLCERLAVFLFHLNAQGGCFEVCCVFCSVRIFFHQGWAATARRL